MPGIKYFCLLLGLSVLFKVTSGPCLAREIPSTVLWAWQRSEDLSTLESDQFAVAYLACHVVLSGQETKEFWRNQPLKVKATTKLIPVMRLDCDRKNSPVLSAQQLERTAAVMRKLAALPQTAAVQIDFDALLSQRDFYKNLLELTKTNLPPKIPLSITALASWCLYDNWIKDLPVDETVPMMFSLGDERQKILLYFRSGHEFLQKSCCQTLGLSLEDKEMNQLMIPLTRNRKIPVRVYVFTRNAWTPKKIRAAQTMLGQP